MAGGYSNYLENKLLDHFLKTATFNQPTNVYIALSVSTITDTATGVSLVGEVSGGAYARETCNAWSAAANGSSKNSTGVTWAQATAVWGTITNFALLDHISTGNVLAYGTLTSAKRVVTDDTVRFATTQIEVTLT